MARRRVLLIQQASSRREALARLLSGEGYEVEVAEVEEADDRIVGFSGDVVLCDAERLDGRSRRDLEQRVPAAKWRLVLLGGDGSSASARPAGRIASLPKPVNMEELRRVLREL